MRSQGRRIAPEMREVLLITIIALIPFERDLTIWSTADASNSAHLRVGLSAFHIPLVALLVLSLIDLVRCPRVPRGPWPRLIAVTALWFGIAVVLNPSWRGMDALLHAAGAWAIWDTVVGARRHARRVFLGALVAFGFLQGALAVMQRIGGGSAGIPLLEAAGPPLSLRGDVYAVRGSFVHQYHLAGSLLVCTSAVFVLLATGTKSSHRRLLLGGLVLLGAIVPMTYSRAAWLAIVPMLVVIVVSLRRDLLLAGATWTVGLVTGALLNLEAVIQRATQTGSVLTGSGRSPGRPVARAFDSGRLELFQQGIEQAGRRPVTGVGPGNYVTALRAQLDVTEDPTAVVQPPHNVVIQFAAEAGVLGGLLTTALLAALAVWSVRGGPLRTVAVLALVPFFLLDLYAYTRQVGIVFSGLWLAVAQLAGRDTEARRPGVSEEPVESASLNGAST